MPRKSQVSCTNIFIALSGACATIASDALMNPFDGTLAQIITGLLLNPPSHQTTDASSWLNLPDHSAMRPLPLSHGRYIVLLRILPHNTVHDCPFHCHTIHGLRVDIADDESEEGVRPDLALRCGWPGGSFRSRYYDTTGCDKDVAADKGTEPAGKHQECEGIAERGEDHKDRVWLEWLFQRTQTENHYDHAEYRHLLVSTSDRC